jgi:selenoprotein W-related protein
VNSVRCSSAAVPFFRRRTAFIATPTATGLQRKNTWRNSSVYFVSASSSNEKVHISIEYCSGCQWMLRSSWIASELLTTFAKESKLASVALVPKSPPLSPGGIFRVLSKGEGDEKSRVLWDRSIEDRFPEAKEVKQLVRDVVDPNKDLGHSDVKEIAKESSTPGECIECKAREDVDGSSKVMSENVEPISTKQQSFPQAFYNSNIISIEFSTGPTISSQKNKLHQAVWYTNDILNMVYERNAWWKKCKDSVQSDQECDAPPAVDIVKLLPVREKLDVLVRCYQVSSMLLCANYLMIQLKS